MQHRYRKSSWRQKIRTLSEEGIGSGDKSHSPGSALDDHTFSVRGKKKKKMGAPRSSLVAEQTSSSSAAPSPPHSAELEEEEGPQERIQESYRNPTGMLQERTEEEKEKFGNEK